MHQHHPAPALPSLRTVHAGALLLAAGLFLIALSIWLYARPARASQQELRLHIFANSDSAADQALKARVRDDLMAEVAPLLQGAPDPAAVHDRLQARLAVLARTAKATVDRAGYDYPVTVELGEFTVGPRRLGRVRLPGGEVAGLRVSIGGGSGHNWWCLLFPPLCLAEATVTTTAKGTVLSAGPRQGKPLLLREERVAPQARFALVDWLRGHGVRAEKLGKLLRIWPGEA